VGEEVTAKGGAFGAAVGATLTTGDLFGSDGTFGPGRSLGIGDGRNEGGGDVIIVGSTAGPEPTAFMDPVSEMVGDPFESFRIMTEATMRTVSARTQPMATQVITRGLLNLLILFIPGSEVLDVFSLSWTAASFEIL
jgi:hypothetical protein